MNLITNKCLVWFIAFFSIATYANAEENLTASSTIILQSEKILNILKTSQGLSPEQKTEKRNEVATIVNDGFDFQEISKRSLGRSWKNFSAEQQADFVAEFKHLLIKTYLDKLFKEFTGQTLTIIKETVLAENKVEVKTKLTLRSEKIAVDYRMHMKENTWLAYDVLVEGVSLIQNYRSQFEETLKKETPDNLIKRLKTKNQKSG